LLELNVLAPILSKISLEYFHEPTLRLDAEDSSPSPDTPARKHGEDAFIGAHIDKRISGAKHCADKFRQKGFVGPRVQNLAAQVRGGVYPEAETILSHDDFSPNAQHAL
jgi:hypothetical protein